MIALLTTLALATIPRHHEIDLSLGMRAGAATQITIEPRPNIELGGRFLAETDVYAGAPSWVRTGLKPKYNLHLTPLGMAGANTGETVVSGAFLFGGGFELFTFREEKRVPALDRPVVYGATGVRAVGAFLADLRIRSKSGLGGHLMFSMPLPLAPTGAPYVDRMHIAVGVIW